MKNHEKDERLVNTLKALVIDGVDKAQSGHPGGAMSSMDLAALLFRDYLHFDPDDAQWMGRDRFILSAGHESMLIYALLHFIGWLELDELKRFRQLHSKTPGHPENDLTPGVECTTGPLGQGAAMSVGFAIAALSHGARFGEELFSQRIVTLLGDGCMQEDITLGAASYAGHLKLKNLTWIYDKNACQISGAINRATSDNEALIFQGFGWDTVEIDGHDHETIRKTYDRAFKTKRERPLLIIANTIMARGAATAEGQHKTHGAPLSKDEAAATKKKWGLNPEPFAIDPQALAYFREGFSERKQVANDWRQRLQATMKTSDAFATQWRRTFDDAPTTKHIPPFDFSKSKDVATRNVFGDLLVSWCSEIPNLIGGSADLEPSNMTEAFAKKVSDFSAENRKGMNLAFGVREFPMSAISNGLALFGGLIPFDATFLTFSDYSRAALRLGALQRVRVIHEFSHDSFHLGEDGPTHQSIEHVMSLRLIPNFWVMRPADAHETEAMLRTAIETQKTPVAIALSRQKLPVLQQLRGREKDIRRGAYVLQEAENAEYIVFATGSEVSLALQVSNAIGANLVKVVSVPCWELFFDQDEAYQDRILSAQIKKRISIEAGVGLGWQRFVGERGLIISIDHFGDSAPAEILAEEYGFTSDKIVARIHSYWK